MWRTEGDTAQYEMQVLDGRWFYISLHPLPDGCTVVVRTEITDLKRSEQNLLESEAIKAGIINSAMDSIIAIDGEGRVVEFNLAAEACFGMSRQEAIGRDLAHLILPDNYPYGQNDSLRQALERRQAASSGQRFEIRAQRADGQRFPAEATLSQVCLGEDCVLTLGLRDITEQRRARKERKRLIQLLRDAIESIPHGFGIYDAAERLVLCNKAFSTPYGLSPDEMAGMSTAESLRRALPQISSLDGRAIDKDAHTLEQVIERVRAAVDKPLEVQWKSGDWKLLTANPTLDGGMVFLRTDITKLKEAEASVREREQLFRQIVEGQPAPVLMVEVGSGRILYASPSAAALFGMPWPPPEELNGRRLLCQPARPGGADAHARARRLGRELRARAEEDRRHALLGLLDQQPGGLRRPRGGDLLHGGHDRAAPA